MEQPYSYAKMSMPAWCVESLCGIFPHSQRRPICRWTSPVRPRPLREGRSSEFSQDAGCFHPLLRHVQDTCVIALQGSDTILPESGVRRGATQSVLSIDLGVQLFRVLPIRLCSLLHGKFDYTPGFFLLYDHDITLNHKAENRDTFRQIARL